MTDVLLTHSYHLYYDRKQARRLQPYPPLGTLYAAALLRQNGFSVECFDSMLEDPDSSFPNAVSRTRPKIVAIYEDNFNFLSKMCLSRMRQVAFKMIDAARACGATVVVNGSDASDHCAEYLRQGADFILLGEAEMTLLELVESLQRESSRPVDDIPGLAYLQRQSSSPIQTAPRPLMRDLNLLPFPGRDLVDIEKYRRVWKRTHGFFSLNLVASRGCPYRCNWCAKPIYGDSFHARSPESVAREMKRLRDGFDADHLWFADDLFGINRRWVESFAEHVKQQDAAMPFKIQSRVDLMSSETVAALKRAGCVEVWMGAESGSQKILDVMDKGTRVDQIVRARENMRQNGIRACYFLQFGYPGENWEDIQQTIRLVRETQPDDVGVSVSYPLPGTKFYENVSRQLDDKTNWVDSQDLSMMFKGAYTSEFYRALHDALHAEVDSWRSEKAWRFVPHDLPESSASAAPKVRELWSEVKRLESSCRNENPTLLPVLA